MTVVQTLQDEIARIKSELAAIRRQNRKSNNPRSKYYVTGYSKLTPVRNGHVHPSILAMYAKEGM